EVSTASASCRCNDEPAPAVGDTPATAPDHVLNEVDLQHQLPVLGAAVRDGRLFLAQGQQNFGPVPLADGSDPGQGTNPPPNLFVSVYDISTLPGVKLLGETNAVVEPLGWG